jgi:hypothetical protein
MVRAVLERLRATPRLYILYTVIYFTWGSINNQLGKLWGIAQFRYDFQVFTCYVLYLVPCSLLVRNLPVFHQYVFGTLALGVLELGGYTLGTSIAYPNNIFDRLFGERNFSLAMALMFAGLLPVGNWLVARADALLPGGGREAGAQPERRPSSSV